MNLLLQPLVLIAALGISLPAEEIAKDVLTALKLPGVKVNLKERAVDVTSIVNLDEGSLEFIACTKDTKEHESIVTIEAKPSHIHTALLLLGAKAGHPAIRKIVGEGDDQRWVDLPPKGSPMTVSFVTTDDAGKQTERPLSDFVTRIDEEGEPDSTEAAKRLKTFLFAGSHLIAQGEGPKTYLADRSGSVISLSTFGDELLCLPEIYGHENHALMWELDSKHLPKIGAKIILRLRPQKKTEAPKR